MKNKKMLALIGLFVFLFVLSPIDAKEKGWSSMKAKPVYNRTAGVKIKIASVEIDGQMNDGFQGVLYSCGFAIFSKCETDDQRFEPK